MLGTMLWFNDEKDLGFISSEDGVRVEVLGTAFVDGARPVGRCAGLPVEFELDPAADEARASTVRLVPEVIPRRARRRGSSFR